MTGERSDQVSENNQIHVCIPIAGNVRLYCRPIKDVDWIFSVNPGPIFNTPISSKRPKIMFRPNFEKSSNNPLSKLSLLRALVTSWVLGLLFMLTFDGPPCNMFK